MKRESSRPIRAPESFIQKVSELQMYSNNFLRNMGVNKKCSFSNMLKLIEEEIPSAETIIKKISKNDEYKKKKSVWDLE